MSPKIEDIESRQTGEQEANDFRATRRETLRRVGASAFAATVGLGGAASTADPVSASHNGTEWDELTGSMGRFPCTHCDDCYHYRDANWVVKYKGWDDEGDEISHHFGFGMLTHTFTAKKECVSCGPIPKAGDQYQDGSILRIYNSDGTEYVNVDNTYPGYVDVSGGTDPNWEDVIKQDDDSIQEYEDDVETHIDWNGGSTTQQEIFKFVAGQVLGAVTGGLGTAWGLATLIFDVSDDQYCGEALTRGEPTVFDWDLCTSDGYDAKVPLNFHHADFELKVPDDGADHTAEVEQEAITSYYDDEYGDYSYDAIEWTFTLPGYHDSASLDGYTKYDS